MKGYGCEDNCQKNKILPNYKYKGKGGDLHLEFFQAEEGDEVVRCLLHLQEALNFIPALTRCIVMCL